MRVTETTRERIITVARMSFDQVDVNQGQSHHCCFLVFRGFGRGPLPFEELELVMDEKKQKAEGRRQLSECGRPLQ